MGYHRVNDQQIPFGQLQLPSVYQDGILPFQAVAQFDFRMTVNLKILGIADIYEISIVLYKQFLVKS